MYVFIYVCVHTSACVYVQKYCFIRDNSFGKLIEGHFNTRVFTYITY